MSGREIKWENHGLVKDVTVSSRSAFLALPSPLTVGTEMMAILMRRMVKLPRRGVTEEDGDPSSGFKRNAIGFEGR